MLSLKVLSKLANKARTTLIRMNKFIMDMKFQLIKLSMDKEKKALMSFMES